MKYGSAGFNQSPFNRGGAIDASGLLRSTAWETGAATNPVRHRSIGGGLPLIAEASAVALHRKRALPIPPVWEWKTEAAPVWSSRDLAEPLKFNQGDFNRGKFNAAGTDTKGHPLVPARWRLTASAEPTFHRPVRGGAAVTGEAVAHCTRRSPVPVLPAGWKHGGQGYITRLRRGKLAPAYWEWRAAAGSRTMRQEEIALPGILLAAGEILEIDTDKITVTIDGRNAIEYWKTGSEAFQLAPGENTLVFIGGTLQSAGVTVIWRERWL